MRINILNECKNCVHHGFCRMEGNREISIRGIMDRYSADVCSEVCKMKDERELITRGIMDSYAIDTNESFIMDLSCKYYASWKVCAPYGKEEPQYEN